MSADPAMGEYFPEASSNEGAAERNKNLPGLGGLYNSRNLQTYHYAGNNRLKYTDPSGRAREADDPSRIHRSSGNGRVSVSEEPKREEQQQQEDPKPQEPKPTERTGMEWYEWHTSEEGKTHRQAKWADEDAENWENFSRIVSVRGVAGWIVALISSKIAGNYRKKVEGWRNKEQEEKNNKQNDKINALKQKNQELQDRVEQLDRKQAELEKRLEALELRRMKQ